MRFFVLLGLVTGVIIGYLKYVDTQKRITSPFFWQPQLLISLVSPKKRAETNTYVALRGYKLSITLMSVVEGFPERHKHPHLNPTSAIFYTDAYRWFIRHLSLIPNWLYGEGGNYAETVKMWRTRFMESDTFMPSWMQRLLFFIPAEQWEQERKEFIEFTKYAGNTFSKHLRYNNKSASFDNYRSHESVDSVDGTTTTTTTTTTGTSTTTTTTSSTTPEPPTTQEPTTTTPGTTTKGHKLYEYYREFYPKKGKTGRQNISNIAKMMNDIQNNNEIRGPLRRKGQKGRKIRSRSNYPDSGNMKIRKRIPAKKKGFQRLLNG